MLNFVATSEVSWMTKNAQKPFSRSFKDRICKIKKTSELYTDENKSNYSNSPNYIFKTATSEFLPKFLRERKFLTKNLTFLKRKYL